MAEGLHQPLSPALHRVLRRAVLDHATAEHRKAFLPLVHVGIPGRREAVFAVRPDEPTDHALRTDIVSAMVRRVRQPGPAPMVWLTRRDPLDAQDVDLAWLASTRSAYGELGLPLVMVVVNRHGWRDPRSGLSRSWHRLRAPAGR
ncbi:hypothetical protein LRP67_12220 [Nocardioides sp. cx-169]|uniref:hypothetical protein n=1 Tax=Nocardioides sp. cx-169 TaxID=2899080 RepID=UPI001E655A4A|nr:hypothetical protein [Nocardioides sp. cx-169]MCD4534851.1 hypothetical protein [Nocardioides sp. cx-169]